MKFFPVHRQSNRWQKIGTDIKDNNLRIITYNCLKFFLCRHASDSRLEVMHLQAAFWLRQLKIKVYSDVLRLFTGFIKAVLIDW